MVYIGVGIVFWLLLMNSQAVQDVFMFFVNIMTFIAGVAVCYVGIVYWWLPLLKGIL